MILILIPRTNVRSGGPITLRVSRKEHTAISTDTNSPKKTESEVKKAGIITKTLNSVLNVTKALLTLGILSYVTLFKIPGVQKLTNEGYRKIEVRPTPISPLNLNKERYLGSMPVDHFVSSYRDFEKIERAVENERIDIEKINLNQNKWVLDESIEINKLIAELKSKNEDKYNEEIKLLEEINLVSGLIFGKNGPITQNISQGGKGICQITSIIQANTLDSENIQRLKSKVKVSNFNPCLKDFRIDFVVELNGHRISIPFEMLVRQMATKDLSNTHAESNDGTIYRPTLYVPVLALALEQSLMKFGGVPSVSSATPATILSSEDYCSVEMSSLSDKDIIEILNKAPNTPILISTQKYIRQNKDFDLSDHLKQIQGKINDIINISFEAENSNTRNIEEKNISFETFKIYADEILNGIKSDNYSKLRAKFFISSLLNHVHYLKTGEDLSPIGKEVIQHTASTSQPTSLVPYHSYAVKGIKQVNGEYIVTLLDQNKEFNLTLDELRMYGNKITATTDSFPNFGVEGTKSLLISLMLITAILFVSHKLNIKLDPNYKSTLIKIGNKLVGRLKRTSS